MEWTMPRNVLHWVAGLLGAAALGSFVMGIVNAPERGGRVRGERPSGQSGAVSVINATEATPLAQERIEAAPKPAPKATNTDDEDEDQTATNATNATPPTKATNATLPPVPTVPTPAETPQPPPEDEPPH
jgi:outer membrane biosynthesis protein TonB